MKQEEAGQTNKKRASNEALTGAPKKLRCLSVTAQKASYVNRIKSDRRLGPPTGTAFKALYVRHLKIETVPNP